jgi:hypothetical protein
VISNVGLFIRYWSLRMTASKLPMTCQAGIRNCQSEQQPVQLCWLQEVNQWLNMCFRCWYS